MSQASPSPIPTLVVMARWPASGRCKGRLASDIGSEQAAIVQQRLTGHTFAVAKALAEQGDIARCAPYRPAPSWIRGEER